MGKVKKINYSWVDLDNELSSEMIVDYLISKDHKKIAFINVEEKYNFAFLRKKGFKKALRKNSIPYDSSIYRTTSLEDPSFTKNITMELLEKNPDLDSIICSTEYASVGAIEACVELGINIGKDISLITYDGPVVESLTNPKITAVAHPLEELGKKAIEILMNQHKNTDNISYLAVPHIIERGSVRSLIKSN